MMRIGWTILVALLSGCATIDSVEPEPLDDRVDRWLLQQEYGKAMDALKTVGPDTPGFARYSEKFSQVTAQAQLYEEETLARSELMLAEEDWPGALELLKSALARLPDSLVLRDALVRLREAQQAAAAEREALIWAAKGEYWVEVLPALREIASILVADDKAQARLASGEKQAAEAAAHLAELGAKAMAKGDKERAVDHLAVAALLSEDPDIAARFRSYRDQLSVEARRSRTDREVEQRRREGRKEQVERERKLSAEAFEKALVDEDFAAAKTHLERFRSLGGGEEAAASMHARFESAAKREAESLYRKGLAHYRSERFQAAVEYWRKVLALVPDHQEARDNLSRAEKVLQKIEELESRQKPR